MTLHDRSARGQAGRPPRRASYPDCGPLAATRRPDPLAVAPAPPPSPSPAAGFAPTPPGRCRLTLEIAGQPYAVLVLGPQDAAAQVIRLTKPDHTVYHVALTVDGPQCDCPDFEFRHRGNGTACKHARALQAVGILAPPIPAPAPLPAGLAWDDVSDRWGIGPDPEDLDPSPAFLAGVSLEGGAR